MYQQPHSAAAVRDQRATMVEPAPTRRSKTSNNPLKRFNGNTRRGRRFSDLLRSYLRAMGNPVEANRQADALAAAELKCAAEDLRARLLAGPTVALGDLEQIVRLENLADRAVRKLGLRPAGKSAAPAVTLAEHLARRAAERAGKPSEVPA
jgi:hypothetical protein